MDFLNNIMSSRYFTIGIFSVVAVLAIIFLILLLGGKKQKKSVVIEEADDNIGKIDDLMSKHIDPSPLEEPQIKVEESAKPVEIKEELPPAPALNLFDMPAPVTENEPALEIDPKETIGLPTLDAMPSFDPEPTLNESAPIMPNLTESTLDSNDSVMPELPKEEVREQTVEAPVEPVQKPIINPQPFSSVYVNKPEEEIKPKEEVPVNEIPMPKAEAPKKSRLFDIEDRDL